jgi:hypothetical protein
MFSRSQILCSLALSSVLLGGIASGADARAGRKITAAMMQEFVGAQLACDTANAAMFDGMTKVATRFAEICRKLRRFPNDYQEYVEVRDVLQKIVPVNPYSKSDVLAKQLAQLSPNTFGKAQSVAILADSGLDAERIDHLRQAPDESWLAYPGSIGILHNRKNLFIVWGAGIDGKPLKDKDGQVRLLTMHPFSRNP